MRTLALIVIAIPVAIWRAFVASVLWGWFAVPLGAPRVGVALAYGLLLIAGLATAHRGDPDDALADVMFAATYPAVCLLAGYVVLQVIGGAA